MSTEASWFHVFDSTRNLWLRQKERSRPMAMLPNDHHPGPRCSCRDCLRQYPGPRLAERGTSRLDKLQISTWINEYADQRARWSACLGEYDQGVHVSYASTQRKAVDELLDWYEQDNGELRK